MWAKTGIFEQAEAVHVAPCREDGMLLIGHWLAPDCPCRPTMPLESSIYPRAFWIHHDGH